MYGNRTKTLRLFARVAAQLVASDAVGDVSFVAMWEHDVQITKTAARTAGARFDETKAATASLHQFMQQVVHADVIVCWRLHCAVFAHALGIPWILLAYRLKAFDFAASVHQMDRVIGMDVATPEMVLAQVQHVVQAPFAWRGDVEAARVGWERASRDLRSRLGPYERGDLRVIGVCRAASSEEAPFAVVGTASSSS